MAFDSATVIYAACKDLALEFSLFEAIDPALNAACGLLIDIIAVIGSNG